MWKPELVGGQKDVSLVRSENFRIRVAEVSQIEEEKIFSEREVWNLIGQVAMAENIDSSHLVITEETRDQGGNLLYLAVSVNQGKAQGHGWKSIEYIYIIKGNHGIEGGSSTSSCVMRVYNLDDLNNTDQGGVVADYVDGQWKLSPGEIADKADWLDPLNE